MGGPPSRVGSTQRRRSTTCVTGAESDVYECLLSLFCCVIVSSGDTTEEAGMTAASDADSKPVSESDVAADKEVDALMSLPVPTAASDVADKITLPCTLPPSPPLDADLASALLSSDRPKPDLRVGDGLQASSCDESTGYASGSSSMLAATDETPDDLQSMSGIGGRDQQLVSAASKYRLRCQCGSKNCRQYLY